MKKLLSLLTAVFASVIFNAECYSQITAVTISSTTVSCNGGANGTAEATPVGGTGPYTYAWSTVPVQTDNIATGLAAGDYTVTVADNTSSATATVTITEPSPLSIPVLSHVDVYCNGGDNGAASVSPATGGAGSYTYDWTPGNPLGNGTTSISGLTAGTYTCTVTDLNSCTATQVFTITQPAALLISPSQTDVVCNGQSNGTANVTVSGGVSSAYTYSWLPSGGTSSAATGLSGITYTCTVTDANSCVAKQVFTILEPAQLTATVTATNSTCPGANNGSAVVTAAGGTSPYTYAWLPSGGSSSAATGLSAITYTVTVKDSHNCLKATTVTIGQPAALNLTVNTASVTCFGGNNGSATATTTGGTSPYTYAWSSSGGSTSAVAGLSAGTYSCTVTDANSCSAVKAFTISTPSALLLPALTKTPGCNGAGATATANPSGGTSPYSYTWLPSGGNGSTASGLAAGNYTATVTDAHGCSISNTVTVVQSPVITLTITPTNILCNGGKGSATVAVSSGGTGPFTYAWNTSPVQNTATATGLSATSYTATVTDANGCSKTASITITQPAALVVPALSKTNATCFGANNGTATASPTGGTTPYTYAWMPSGGTSSAATGLSPANYTVTVTDANGCSKTASTSISQPNAVSINSLNQTSVGCNGGLGSAAATVTGGTPGYTYSWLPSGGSASTATGLTAGNYTLTVYDSQACVANRTVTIVSSSINVSTSQTNVLCNGGKGTATAIASLGTQPYTYAWSPSGGSSSTATGLSPGNYSVTVTETMGCSMTATVSITQPAALTLTVTKTNGLCAGANNGTAAVSPAGGTIPYTYAWTGGGGQTTSAVSGLAAGGYTVTVTDANGCSKNGSVTITEPSALLTTMSQTNSCNSGLGTATVNATGGTATYTYAWNTSPVQTTKTATALPVGNYSVLVTDANGCTTFNAVAIVQLPLINLTTSQTTIACNGGKATATANASGGSGTLSYLWAPGGQTIPAVTGLSAGNYSVTVTDANLCSVTATVSITQPAALTLTVTKTNILCNGGKGTAAVAVTGGTAPYSYAWSTTPVQTTANITGLDAGNYSVTVTDANGCTKSSTTTIVQPALLLTSTTQFHIYDGTTGSATATVSGGVPGYTYNWNTTPFQASATATGLYAGNYTVTVTDANGCTNKNRVTIISTKARRLAAGQDHSLAKCQNDVTVFGKNNYGQLGDNTIVNKDTAIVLAGLSAVTVLEGGGVHSLALKNDGNILVWGRSNNGQLGLGNTLDQHAPILLNSLNKIISIAAGGNHSLALKNDGTVWAWGLNTNGQLGDNTITLKNAPVKVNILTNAIHVSSGTNHSLAILGDSTVWAWGANASGQLGDKSTTDRRVPVKVKNVSGVVAVAGGNGHSVALKNDGTVWTWGLNADGQLGDGTNVNKDTAIKVMGLTNVIAISAGDRHSLALKSDGTVWSWGLNADGQLGDVTNTSRNVPVNVNGLTGVTSIQGGGSHSLAVKNNGQVWAWGKNSDGQLGNKSNVSKNVPVMTHMPCLIKNLAVTTTQVNVKCNGTKSGSATVIPSGGAAPYTYVWSISPAQTTQTATGLLAGNYSVTVSDANTFSTGIVVTITEPLALTTSVTANNISCFGANNGTAAVTVSGGTPNYQYVWNTVPGQTTSMVTGLKPGNYTVYVSDVNACNVTSTVTITQPASALGVNIVGIINATSCSNSDGSIITTTSGGVPNYSYAWSTTPVQTNATAAGLSQGTYTLVVTDANNCSKSISGVVNCPTGINELPAEIEFSVYPNPSNGKYQVASSAGIQGTLSIEVYSLLGERVCSVSNPAGQSINEVDISQQPAGVYFMHLKLNDEIVVKKIIKD